MGFGYDGLGDEAFDSFDSAGGFAPVGMGAVAATMGEIGVGMLARVATNDPAPLGDLNARSGPGTSYGKVGGVDKDGIVRVLDLAEDSQGRSWAKVSWPGGRNPGFGEGWVAGWLLESAPDAPAPGPDPDAPPPVPVPGGGYTPASTRTSGGMSTGAKVGIAAGVAALAGLAWYAFTD